MSKKPVCNHCGEECETPTNLEMRAARWIGGARALLTRATYTDEDAVLCEELLGTPWPEPEPDWDEEIEAAKNG